MSMFRAAFSLLSPDGYNARLTTLLFHRVHAAINSLAPEEPDAKRFDSICGWLASWFRVLPLDEAVALLRERRLPGRAACITFDDGYADNHDVALPILQRHRLPATFFVATGFLDGGRMFNDGLIELVRRSPLQELSTEGLGLETPATLPLGDPAARRAAAQVLIDAIKYRPPADRMVLVETLRRRAEVASLPDDLMMRSDQVRALHRAGMHIGAHTVTHPILARLDDTAARAEITDGRRALESITGAPVRLFAYPNGRPERDYTERDVRIVRELGFAGAVSTAWGRADADADAYQLPRFTPWDRSAARFGLRLLDNLRRVPQVLPATTA